MAIPTGTKINKKEKGLIWQYPPEQKLTKKKKA
jgi:hypothetical protein